MTGWLMSVDCGRLIGPVSIGGNTNQKRNPQLYSSFIEKKQERQDNQEGLGGKKGGVGDRPHRLSRNVETMAMTQRDNTIEAIKRLDACGRLRALLQRPATQARLRLGRYLRVRRWRISPPKRSFCGASLEYAVMHDDEEEAGRIREELRRLTDEV